MRVPILCCFALIAASAQPRLSAPITGYVFDRNAGSIRALTGVPGAFAAADRVALPESFASSFQHPARPLAVAITKDGTVAIINWSDPAQVRRTALGTRFGAPIAVQFAQSLDQALLVAAGGVEIWSGLSGNAPDLVLAIAADSLGGTPAGGAALSFDGTSAAVALTSEQLVRVANSAVQPLGSGRSAAFLPLSTSLVTLDSSGNLSLLDGNGATAQLATGLAADGILAAMTGFTGIVVLSQANGTVALVDTANGGSVTQIDCHCSPSGVTQALPFPGLLYFEDPVLGGFALDATSGTLRVVPVAGIGGWNN